MGNSIGKEIAKGSLFYGIAKYSSMAVNLIITAILARILEPSIFGIVAITTVFISFFDILANMGFGPAIIQNKDLSKQDLSSILKLTIVVALIFSLGFFFLASPISRYYNEPQLLDVLRFLSIQILCNCIKIVPSSLLLKNKKFKLISYISLINTVLWGLMSVVSAYCGIGIYSLLVVPVMSSITTCIVDFYLTKDSIIFKSKFSINSITKILRFSTYQFLFNLVNFFSRNLDKLLIGKYLGMSVLGQYEKSYRVMTLPISSLTNVLTPTIQPILSNYEKSKEVILDYYFKLSKVLLFVGAFLTPFMFMSSKEIILVLFGDQWVDAIPVFRILSLSILFQLIDSLSGSILQSANKANFLFYSGLLSVLINVTAIILGVSFFKEIQITAILLDVSFFINVIISIVLIVKYSLNGSVVQYLKLFIYPIVCFITISVILHLYSSFLSSSIIFLDLCIKLFLSLISVLISNKFVSYINIDLKKFIKKK